MKRQRLDDEGNSKAVEVGSSSAPYIVFDVYSDRQSFQHKKDVASHIVVWLQDEVDFDQLKQIGERVKAVEGKECQLALAQECQHVIINFNFNFKH